MYMVSKVRDFFVYYCCYERDCNLCISPYLTYHITFPEAADEYLLYIISKDIYFKWSKLCTFVRCSHSFRYLHFLLVKENRRGWCALLNCVKLWRLGAEELYSSLTYFVPHLNTWFIFRDRTSASTPSSWAGWHLIIRWDLFCMCSRCRSGLTR